MAKKVLDSVNMNYRGDRSVTTKRNIREDLTAIVRSIKAAADSNLDDVNYAMSRGEIKLQRTLNDPGDNLGYRGKR